MLIFEAKEYTEAEDKMMHDLHKIRKAMGEKGLTVQHIHESAKSLMDQFNLPVIESAISTIPSR